MQRVSRWMGTAVSVSWLLCVLTWLWDVGGGGVPRGLAQAIVGGAGVISIVACLWMVGEISRRGTSRSPWTAGRILLLLVLVSLAIHATGVTWEITGRYYRDEGIYYAAAGDINQGRLLPESFIYGHLPYYLYALVLWIQALFPTLVTWLASSLFGLSKELDVSWLLLRGCNTTLGALTAVPVFLIGKRVAGLAAAVLSALLIVFSPLYIEITQLIISDVPAAFFATVSLLFVARLLDGERTTDYLLAGATAGLAAACKYPAGVVAVAIVAIWFYWRLSRRDWSWNLLWAGLVALASLLAVMPAFLAHSESAFAGQGKDLLFGLRQYGSGGWIGVMPGSNTRYYGELIVGSFGLTVVVLGMLGWWRWQRKERRRIWLMLPFPTLYLGLIVAMSMVVKRNLLPVVPALAVLFGIGIAGWMRWIGQRAAPRSTVWWTLLLGVSLAWPIYRTTLQTIAFARPSTREEAASWINAHVAPGATIIKESYTPHLHPKKYTLHQIRFAGRMPVEEVRSGEWDFLLLAHNAYGRFLDPENWSKPHHEIYAWHYEELLHLEKAREFIPGRLRSGPELQLFKVDPRELVYRDTYRYAFEGTGFTYPRDDAYLLLKEYMMPGEYRFTLDTEPADVAGRIRAVTRDNREAGEFAVSSNQATGNLPWSAKYFFYIYLPAGTEIRAFTADCIGD